MRHIFFVMALLLPFCIFAQLKEEFNGPEITSANSWKGELTQFKINQDGMLQLQATGAGESAYIYTGLCLFHNNEWSFRLKNEYTGTTRNHIRVYIWSQDPEIENPTHAVYIRTGSSDNRIALCYQNGHNTYVIHEGRPLFREKQNVEIRVITDNKGNCTYFTRCEGEAVFTEEGTGELNLSHTTSGYFILAAKFTSTHRQDMYYDDISIAQFTEVGKQPDNPDNPEDREGWLQILSEYQESPFEIILVFDQPVRVDNASFLLSDIGEADRKSLSENKQVLTLQWDTPMQYEKTYTLNYEGIYDGNEHDYGGSFTFVSSYDPRMYESAAEGAVIISEIMADPKGLIHLPETEYVELYNTTDDPRQLKGWKFVYDKTEVDLPDLELPSGGYVVLFRSGREIQVSPDGYSVGLAKFPAQLANKGKEVGLKDHTDKWIDQIVYTEAKAGVSWERLGEGWYLSTDSKGGTPGTVNSTPKPDEPEDPDPEEPGEPEQPIEPEEPEQPEPAPYGSIRINEVMADPKGLVLLPETEYVELVNTTNKTYSLKNWVFIYGTTEVVLETCELPADGYLVLFRKGRDLFVDPTGYSMPLAHFPSQLANNGKELMLKDPTGKLIDEVAYPKAKPGISYERAEEGWYLSTDPRGGTPGAINSIPEEEPEKPEDPGEKPEDPEKPVIPDEQMPEPFEIIFNEILPEPFKGGSEYIELYNRSDRTLSLAGLAVSTRKNDGVLSTRYPLQSVSTVLEPGDYVLLTKSIEGVTSFYHTERSDNLYELKIPVLANTASTLVLYRIDNASVVDEVGYSSKWHASSVKDFKGVSLERIDPDSKTQSADNWISATSAAGHGTPGYRNSQHKAGSGDVTGITIPEFNPFTDGYDIKYYLNEAGYTCRAWAYNMSGVKVAEIANQELLGTDGMLFWDGTGRDGMRLQQGLYIFYVELAHPIIGDIKRFKKVFLVK